MFLIQIDVQCADKFFEVLPNEVENAEYAVEDLVCQILLAHFDEVMVDGVTITFSPRSPEGQYHCSIHIHAHCPVKSSSLSPYKLEHLELVVEERISSALVELFGTVNAERVSISSSPCENIAP
jgi:hypothetical protein